MLNSSFRHLVYCNSWNLVTQSGEVIITWSWTRLFADVVKTNGGPKSIQPDILKTYGAPKLMQQGCVRLFV